MTDAAPLEGDTRTLPEKYISFGDCRAYIAKIGEPSVYRIRWTCGLFIDLVLVSTWKQAKPVLRDAHKYAHSLTEEEPPMGDADPPPPVAS